MLADSGRGRERTHSHLALADRQREALVVGGWTLIDATLFAVSAVVGAWLRYDFTVNETRIHTILQFTVGILVLHLAVGTVMSFGRSRPLRGSFEEALDLARTVACTSAIGIAFVLFLRLPSVPRSLPFLAPIIAIVLMCAVRFMLRAYRWGRTSVHTTDEAVVILGMGPRGQALVRTLLREQRSPRDGRLVPVAALDDDPRHRRLSVEGVRVRGTSEDIVRVASSVGAQKVIVAVPDPGRELMTRIHHLAYRAGLEVLLMPPIREALEPSRTDLRHLHLEDLLGRAPARLDEISIRSAITGRRVLVTGAGGSIGSELCRQIAAFEPSKMVLLDRDESALHATQLSMTGRALLDDGTLALGDIRDPDQLRRIFEVERPQVVFHTAALKHLTLLEHYPQEAWKSNVVGTLNVLEASRQIGVDTFVNISTDKAAHPSSVLGYSKRLGERLTAAYAGRDDGTYVSVRFGNVLGSRGSVLTAFTQQIERGDPVTVTDPDVERYFMLIPEACQLVLQASSIGSSGEVMVLDMGDPVRIADMARTLIELSGRQDARIVYTGLRAGEKLSEELFAPGEDVRRSAHPMVFSTDVQPLDPADVAHAVLTEPEEAFDWMRVESSAGVAEAEMTPEPNDPAAAYDDEPQASAPSGGRLAGAGRD